MVTLQAFRKLALSFPETTEEPHHEKTSFRVKKKIFATYDHANNRACLKLSEIDQDVFASTNKSIIYPVDNKWGKQGWTLVELKKVRSDVFTDALTTAYFAVAPQKLAQKLKTQSMNKEIQAYNNKQTTTDKAICNVLANTIDHVLTEAESKIWHAHPVWFLDGNPVVGYSKLKDSIRLMFWSGIDFDEDKLEPGTGKFKDASIRYTSVDEVNVRDLTRWVKKSRDIQWDYKNIVKRKGKLVRLKG